MDITHIPICYFPTTAVFIDDEPNLLDNFKIKLGRTIPVKTFQRPTEALEFFQANPTEPIARELMSSGDHIYDHLTTNVDLRAIDQQVYHPERFQDITVVVVDYAMPDMDGLTFSRALRKLKKKNIRIILLTGEADHSLAVEAFNLGVIDQFILKSVSQMSQVVTQAIRDQQMKYFEKQSEDVLNSSYEQSRKLEAMLSDPAFMALFKKLCEDRKIVEYYLLESEGSYLLMDEKGKGSIFVIKSQEAIDDYYDLAVHGEDVPASVLDSLKTYSHVPLFYLGSDLRTPPEAWGPYLHAATKLVGDNGVGYYYALLDDAEDRGLKAEKIVTYNQYLHQL